MEPSEEESMPHIVERLEAISGYKELSEELRQAIQKEALEMITGAYDEGKDDAEEETSEDSD